MARYRFYRRVFEGSPLFGASLSTKITVIDSDTLTLAQIYSAETGTSTPGNPFFLSEVGKFDFWAEAGNYQVIAEAGGESDEVNERIGPYGGDVGGQVDSVVAGAGMNVDSSDPVNPVVTSRIEPATTSASYALTASNENQIMEITGSGTVNITIPVDSTTDLPIGFSHIVRPVNAFSGTATWVAESGSVTVSSPASGTLVAPAGEASAAIKMAANSWVIVGVTVAV